MAKCWHVGGSRDVFVSCEAYCEVPLEAAMRKHTVLRSPQDGVNKKVSEPQAARAKI